MFYFVCRDAEELEATSLKQRLSLGVVLSKGLIKCSINFDDKELLCTVEVHDERTDRVLSPELQPGQLTIS